MPFDESQPYDVVGDQPKFDPSQPFEHVVAEQPPIIPKSGAQMDSLAAREIAPQLQAGVEAAAAAVPEAFGGAMKAQQVVMNPASLLADEITPKPVADFMRQQLVSGEAVDTVRQAAQYPIPTLSNILFGTDFKEQGLLAAAGKFSSEQIAGQTTPENLAIMAGTAGIGAAEGILAKKAPSLAESLFGRVGKEAEAATVATETTVKGPPPVPSELLGPGTTAGDVTRALQGSGWEKRFQMIDEPKPEIAPVRPLEEQVSELQGQKIRQTPEGDVPVTDEMRGGRTGVQSETARVGGEPNDRSSNLSNPNDSARSDNAGSPPDLAAAVEPGQGTEAQPAQEVAPTVPPVESTPALEVKTEPVVPPEKVQPVEFGQKGYTAVDTAPEASNPPAQTQYGEPQSRGISQAATEAELGKGSVEPGAGAEMGSGLEHGRDYINKGGDPRLPIRRAETSGMVGKDDVGAVHAELERLRGERNQAATALEASPDDPVLQNKFAQADDAQRAWRKELQPVLTKASDSLREAYALSRPNADPSTYQGLADLMDEHFKGTVERTPEMRTEMAKSARGLRESKVIANGELGKVEETLTKQIKSGKVMTPEELHADLNGELKIQFKDCFLNA